MAKEEDIIKLRNRKRVFLPPEENHIGNTLTKLKTEVFCLKETIDLIVNDNRLGVSQNRGQISKDMIEAAFRTLTAYDKTFRPIKLTTDQASRILNMVEDVLNGRREAIQFQLSRECEGIKEVFSQEIFINKSGK